MNDGQRTEILELLQEFRFEPLTSGLQRRILEKLLSANLMVPVRTVGKNERSDLVITFIDRTEFTISLDNVQ